MHDTAHVFPAHVEQRLVEASKSHPGPPPGESFERTRAVEAAIVYAKIQCPQFFKEQH